MRAGDGPFGDHPCDCGCLWRRGHYRPSWPWGDIDNVGPEYEPSVRPMDHLRAVGYSDDPEVVDNRYWTGLFFGAPTLRAREILFPTSASWPVLRCQAEGRRPARLGGLRREQAQLGVGPAVVLGHAVALPRGGGFARQLPPLVARGWPFRAGPMGETRQEHPAPLQGSIYPAAVPLDAAGTRETGTTGGRRGAAFYAEESLGESFWGRDLSGRLGDGSYRRGGEGLSRARPEDTPDQGHPIPTQGVHRDGPRENARYAYRGTIVGEASHPGTTVLDASFRGGATPAYHHWDLAGARAREPCTPGGEEMLEASPMGESRHGHPYFPQGQHRTGPRESVRYGYRGTVVGEASHPGPAPPAADLAGAPAPGGVLRYMRPTAQAGPGTSRGGSHRQSKGGKARGAGRRGRSFVGLRAPGFVVPDAVPLSGGDDDGAGGTLPRPGNATPPDPAADLPPAFAHAAVGGAPCLGGDWLLRGQWRIGEGSWWVRWVHGRSRLPFWDHL